MSWQGFTSIARSEIDPALKNDLIELERYVRSLEDRISLLSAEDSVATVRESQTDITVTEHADQHANGGGDLITAKDFTWTGTHTFTNATISGTFDGRDVSVDGTTQDSHIASTANPHTVTLEQAIAANATASSEPTLNGGAIVNDHLGLGTATVPHGGVGLASVVLAVDGASGGANGPHWQVTTAADDHPIAQYFHGGHDNVGFAMDAYYDGDPGGKWRMGDASAFTVYKNTDWLRFTYATGSVGTELVQNIGMAMDSSGVFFKGTPTNADRFLYESISPTLTGTWNFGGATVTGITADHIFEGGDSTTALDDTLVFDGGNST